MSEGIWSLLTGEEREEETKERKNSTLLITQINSNKLS